MPAMAAASAAAHLSLVFLPGTPAERVTAPTRVAVEIREPAPPPVAEPEASAPAAALEPEPEPARKPGRSPTPAPEPAADQSPPPPPPVIGIDLGSTVEGGAGPAFAAGNSRAGETESRARDPRSIDPAPATVPPRGAAATTGNRAASRVPGAAGAELVKPRRMRSLRPTYPELLKARGIEANVTVAVRLDASGRVAGVELVAASDHDEFNRAALATARRERFSPARRGDRPIDFTLTFTYRFRLGDA
jgi:protein TonB